MRHSFFIITLLFLFSTAGMAEGDWRDKVELLTYSPRYFGPNAFPIPLLRTAKVGKYYEAEVRGEYHYFSGDKSRNFYGRAYLPFIRGKAGMEVSFVLYEKYKTTIETRDERNAVEAESPITCHGDVIINSFFQILENDRWFDAMISANLKTASGGRLCDARYTDAASYWIDLTLGRDIIRSDAHDFKLRIQAMGGFYCWMTNDMIHRQNDAISFGAGFTASYRHFTLHSDVSGFHGYENNGDSPLVWRNNLRFELSKNVLSFRYNIGMKDYLYDSLSIGYIRLF